MLIVKYLVKDSNNKEKNTCNIHTEYANMFGKGTGWSGMSWSGFPTFFRLKRKTADDVSTSGGHYFSTGCVEGIRAPLTAVGSELR